MKDAVRIRLERRGDSVNVEYADGGREFDPLSSPPPDLGASLAERQAGGLGLHLVRRTMSDLKYIRSGEWNHITMRRPV